METRYLGLDVHRDFAVVVGLDRFQQMVLKPTKIRTLQFQQWAQKNIQPTDVVALEACSLAWTFYDWLKGYASEVKVANTYKLKLISQSSAKTDKHDALVLAKLTACNLLPEIWVPPPAVRELRQLIAHRTKLIAKRTRCKNHLHAILIAFGRRFPEKGSPFALKNHDWWLTLEVPEFEQLRIKHEIDLLQQLEVQIKETDDLIANYSTRAPWVEEVAFLIQMPGIGLIHAMTILAAIGEIGRFPTAKQLIGYTGLGARVHASGNKVRTGKISKSGRAELRKTMLECAWSAVRYSAHWRDEYERLQKNTGHKLKAITGVARKILVTIWHLLTRREIFRHTSPEKIARSLMKWAAENRVASSSGLSRAAFVKRELHTLGLGESLQFFVYKSETIRLSETVGAFP